MSLCFTRTRKPFYRDCLDEPRQRSLEVNHCLCNTRFTLFTVEDHSAGLVGRDLTWSREKGCSKTGRNEIKKEVL